MARDPDTIERDIEQARTALAATLDELGSGIVVFNHDLRLVGIPTARLGDPLPEGSDRYPPTALWASHPGAFAVGLLHGLRAEPPGVAGLLDRRGVDSKGRVATSVYAVAQEKQM